MRFVIALAIIGACTNSLPAQQPEPVIAPPVFRTVSGFDKDAGHIILTEVITRYVTELETRVVNVGGVQRNIVQARQRKVFEQRTMVVDVSKGRVITADGKQITLDETWNRLRKDLVVGISDDPNLANQSYLRVLRQDMLIFIPAAEKQ